MRLLTAGNDRLGVFAVRSPTRHFTWRDEKAFGNVWRHLLLLQDWPRVPRSQDDAEHTVMHRTAHNSHPAPKGNNTETEI